MQENDRGGRQNKHKLQGAPTPGEAPKLINAPSHVLYECINEMLCACCKYIF